jgi:molecular chaperone Hsp33
MDRYQGIVALEGVTLADMTGSYFRRSEQLQSQVHLACARGEDGWRATALVIEKVAGEGGVDPEADAEAQEEAWRTAQVLAGTITAAELLDDRLSSERLLHRLFHAEGLALDRPRALSYGCRCSRARLAQVLEGFPPADLDHMAESGAITMTCEFCNLDFRFARDEVQGRAGTA